MPRLRDGFLIALASTLAMAAALAPAAALADAVATTTPADQVSYTTARLNGTANPTNPDSHYYFQYGTSSTFSGGETTPVQAIGTGSQTVHATVSDLQPGQTYYFQLVVFGDYPDTTPHYGGVLHFTTVSVAPGAVATTGSATYIRAHSAMLNGAVDATSSDSAWFFEYGTSTAYGKVTKPQPIGKGLHAVSLTLAGLASGVTYHYRLVVVQGSYPTPTSSYGADASFKTKSYGTLSLTRRKLRVKKRHVGIRVKCSGSASAICQGRVALTAKGAHGKTVRCAGARFSLHGGQKAVLKRHLRGGCLALLAAKANHRLKARARVTFVAGQSAFKTKVTLIG